MWIKVDETSEHYFENKAKVTDMFGKNWNNKGVRTSYEGGKWKFSLRSEASNL